MKTMITALVLLSSLVAVGPAHAATYKCRQINLLIADDGETIYSGSHDWESSQDQSGGYISHGGGATLYTTTTCSLNASGGGGGSSW